jgi:hypothetical protein
MFSHRRAQVALYKEVRLLRLAVERMQDQLQEPPVTVLPEPEPLRPLLMEALRPLAEALQRQDQLTVQRTASLEDLILEVLQSVQPSQQEILRQGLTLPSSPVNSGR